MFELMGFHGVILAKIENGKKLLESLTRHNILTGRRHLLCSTSKRALLQWGRMLQICIVDNIGNG